MKKTKVTKHTHEVERRIDWSNSEGSQAALILFGALIVIFCFVLLVFTTVYTIDGWDGSLSQVSPETDAHMVVGAFVLMVLSGIIYLLKAFMTSELVATKIKK